MGRKQKKDTYVNVDKEALRKIAEESPFSQSEITTIMGYGKNWFTNTLNKDYAISTVDIDKLAMLLQFKPEDIIIKDEPKEEPKAEESSPAVPAVTSGEIVEELKKLNATCTQILAELKLAINGPEKIPISKTERAASLLRKEFVGKSGAGIKEEEFKKLLINAGIGSSYISEAMNTVGAHRMFANNGIAYIVKDEVVKA